MNKRKTRENVVEEIKEDLLTVTDEPFRVVIGCDDGGSSIDIFLDEISKSKEVMEKYRMKYPKQRIIVIVKATEQELVQNYDDHGTI